ncbi:MAG TPA: hypothetical protein P5556_05365 [Candidatus Gastranaerophilales bacterium]|nr:hypothetical protein [Candidatus Gastranaerophilales bacterium]
MVSITLPTSVTARPHAKELQQIQQGRYLLGRFNPPQKQSFNVLKSMPSNPAVATKPQTGLPAVKVASDYINQDNFKAARNIMPLNLKA